LAKIGVLIIDDDVASQSAARQVLDSEGWHVHSVPLLADALAELSTGEWSLVIANITMIGMTGPIFSTLRELALAPAVEDGHIRARVLFLVPEEVAPKIQPQLEKERLPYVLRPFHFHDFIEKVSDLLLETATLDAPIRRVRHEAGAAERQRQERITGHEADVKRGSRQTQMFAKREEYVMTEEEINEYEKAEQESRQAKKKKRPEHF